jgi:hypothetical protein
VDVEQDDVRVRVPDQRHRLLDGGRLADEVDRVAELGAHARAEQAMVVHEHDAPSHARLPGSVSSTSVPSPGAEAIVAVPPTRRMRPSIDSAIPRRSSATRERSKPTPRSRTNTLTVPFSTSA